MNPPPAPPEPEPIVRPRKLVENFPPLVVVHLADDVVYLEAQNRTVTVSDWILNLENEPPSLIACQYAGRLLEEAHSNWANHPRWQFRVAPIEETIPDSSATVMIRTLVSFFGFAGKVKGLAHRANRYFHCLDPLQFGRTNLRELALEGERELVTIYRWADEIRNFCLAQQLKPTPTRGGLAKQLLRDPRFYPEARRKVPKATNDKTRKHLPGNHYELNAERGRLYSGLYLDQVSSHHTIAATLPLPAAEGLHARGHFHSLKDSPYARPGTSRYARLIIEHGLLYVRIRIRPSPQTRYLPPWAVLPSIIDSDHRKQLGEEESASRLRGEKLAYLWTNELRLLERYGAQIVYIIAAWTSPNVDQGIARYASWAKEYLREAPGPTQAWLKPTLLTLYGMLATRPRKPKSGWWRANDGQSTLLPIGRNLLEVQIKEAMQEGEPSTNNVLQRGMIEAEMRGRSLELAADLEDQGVEILCIYADAVMIHPPASLPLIPAYWRPKGSLNFLRFLDETHFASREMVRLPGVKRDSPVRLNLSETFDKVHVRGQPNVGGSPNGNVGQRPRQALV